MTADLSHSDVSAAEFSAADGAARPARVLVTICTRGRPRLLSSCLDSVCAQAPHPGADMEILVVENNERLTCADLVARKSRESGKTIHVVLEPELGIPFARNRCGVWAQQNGYDWALYVDDDEIARHDWFRTMAEASRVYQADVLYGRVVPIYPPDSPEWMIAPDMDKRPRGMVLRKAEGHNTMVRTRVFDPQGMSLSFDGAMRFTGGSDTDFFSRVARAGGRIVWIGDAIVDELVPESRMRLRWQLHRTFRVAINISVQHEKLRGKGIAMTRSLVKGIGRSLGGLLTLPAALLIPFAPGATGLALKRFSFRSAKQLASGLGSFAYAFGVRPQPYRQVDGG
jgi:succinoglycan biosynthesis protein ExoM